MKIKKFNELNESEKPDQKKFKEIVRILRTCDESLLDSVLEFIKKKNKQ